LDSAKSALDELFSCLVISIHFGQAKRSLHRAGMQQSVQHDVLRNDARPLKGAALPNRCLGG
jgi:hypothetical protein